MIKWAHSASGFRRNTITVFAAAAGSQAVSLVAMPLLTRLYSPDAFATLGSYSAALTVALVFASLRYESAIPVAVSDDDAHHLVSLSLTLVCVSSAVSLIIIGAALWLFRGHLERDAFVYLAIPIGLLFAGAYQALSAWHVRMRSFRSLAATRAAQGLSGVLLQVGAGVFSMTPWGLVAGDVASRSVGATSLWKSVSQAHKMASISWRGVRHAAVRYAHFPRTLMAASALNIGSLQLPIFAFPLVFGTHAGGLYFLAYRIIFAPAMLIASSVGQVFLGEVSSAREDPTALRGRSLSLASALIAVIGPIYLALTFSGQVIFELLFGAEWSGAGMLAQMLAPLALARSLANPLSGLVALGGTLRDNLVLNAADFALKVAAVGLGLATNSLTLATMHIAVFGVLLSIISLGRFLVIAGVPAKSALHALTRPFAVACVPGLLTYGAMVGLPKHISLPASVAILVGSALVSMTRLLSAKRR